MAKHPLTKREEQRDISRRALIKWSVAAGAALGVSRAKIFDILDKTAGRDVAWAASQSLTTRSVQIHAGNGGLAWFTQLIPFPGIATSGNGAFSYVGMGGATLMPGVGTKYVVNPTLSPFANLPAALQWTCFLCGNNETHTNTPTSTTSLNGANISAIAGALQASAPSVIPAIQIADADFGNAAGAPRPAQVGNAQGIVGLFNSAASRAGGLLATRANADLYKAQYDAFTQLNRAANRSTTKASYMTASGAAGFLGTNLSAKLTITPADEMRYGLNGGTRNNVRQIGEALAIGAKAFKMGLTNSITLPAMRDDPHGAFDGGDINSVPQQLKGIFDGFMADLTAMTDDVTGETLRDTTTIVIVGDTFKDPRSRPGWGDGTPQNTNVMYIYSAGHLKSGWFGDITGNAVQGFDANGQPATYNGAQTARIAAASFAYAVAKRDDRMISQFANGIKIGGVFGLLKDA
jgi:hypothetical protein